MARKSPLSTLLTRLSTIRGSAREPAARALLHDVFDRAQGVVVARAAEMVAETALDGKAPDAPAGTVDETWAAEFVPDMLAAFARRCDEPGRHDKSAAGKRALADALDKLECADPTPFLRGVAYTQVEMGDDKAAPLRARSLAALVRLRHPDRLLLLADLLWDAAETVRSDAARVAVYEGSDGAEALLRARLRAGDDEAVRAEIFAALLAMGGDKNAPLVAGFLQDPDVREQAAIALGESRLPAALSALTEAWDDAVRWEEREAAVFGVALNGGDAAMALLKERLEKADGDERNRIVATLELAFGEGSPRLARLVVA